MAQLLKQCPITQAIVISLNVRNTLVLPHANKGKGFVHMEELFWIITQT